MSKSFKIRSSIEFAAAHHIRGYDGDCARPHGHNYKVEIEALVTDLSSIGIGVDFKDLKKTLKPIVDRFDHQDLNTIPPFDDINPTAETLARYFFETFEIEMKKRPELNPMTLQSVTVWENPNLSVTYSA